MNRALAILLLALLAACQSSPSLPFTQTEKWINDFKTLYAPDSRTALFDISCSRDGTKVLLSGSTNLAETKQQLLDSLNAHTIDFIDSIRLLPDARLKQLNYGLVNLSVSNIRSEPRHPAQLSTQATLGTPLRVLDQQDNWYLIQTPDDYFGWIDAGGLQLLPKVAFDDWQKAPKVVYLPQYGFALQQADLQSPPIADLLAGNILLNTGANGDFTEVSFPDGRRAFVPKNELMDYSDWINSRNPQVDAILETATSLLGRPYLWGGTSGKGMDCSGFTKTVFYLNGLLLPRDASQQVHTGQLVETDTTLKNLLPGDFLFFGRKATKEKKERITHVAIYQGGGKIIHAAGRVQVQSLIRGEPDFAEDRLHTLVRAKRMLPASPEYGIISLQQSPWY